MASYVPLEPTAFQSLEIQQSPTFNSADVSFFATSSFIYTLLFAAIVGAAFYEYILVGVYRMEASENGIRKSNETFKRTTLGLLGVFSLFLIIFTINKGLLTGDVGLGEFKAGAIPASTAVTIPSLSSGYTYNERKTSHAANAADLWSVGINTNKLGQLCSEEAMKTGSGCTSLAFLSPQTITMLKNLKRACPECNLIITGGTENGHKSHCEGGGNVDLRLQNRRNDPNNQDPLYVFLKKNATQTDINSNCYIRYYYNGYRFCDEREPAAQHFHVDSPTQCRNGKPL